MEHQALGYWLDWHVLNWYIHCFLGEIFFQGGGGMEITNATLLSQIVWDKNWLNRVYMKSSQIQ